MLEAMCQEDTRLKASRLDFRQASANSFGTMEILEEEYPQARIYFLVGADKLSLIVLMQKKCGLLDKHYVMICTREGVDPKTWIEKNETLNKYIDRFAFVIQPEGMEKISSTAVRNHILMGGKQKLICIRQCGACCGIFLRKSSVSRSLNSRKNMLSSGISILRHLRGRA